MHLPRPKPADVVLPGHELRMAVRVAMRFTPLLDGFNPRDRGVHAFGGELELYFLTGLH